IHIYSLYIGKQRINAETESNEDEIYKYKIQVHKDVDVEMEEVKTVKRENKEKDEMIDAAKADDEKTVEEKGDVELAGNATTSDRQVKEFTELPLTSSSLYVSCGFVTHFLKLSFDVSFTGVQKDSAKAKMSSLMDIHIQQETSQIQSPLVLKVHVSVITKTTNVPPIPKIPTRTLVSTALSSPQVTPTISIVQQTTTPIPTPPITTDALTITTIVPEFDALSTVQLRDYLGTKLDDSLHKVQTLIINLEQESEKSPSKICKIKRVHTEKQKMLKYTIKSTDKAHDDEDPLAGPNQGNKTKRRRTKESESSKKPFTAKETSKGKAPSKNPKTGKSATAKDPIDEPTAEVEMDDVVNTATKDVVHDAKQPNDDATQAKDKAPKKDWFKQPQRPPTPDQKWNKRQVLLEQLEQPWFNQMVSAAKDPLTFNDLMAILINYSKYVLNQLQMDHLTQEILIGPTYNLLKGTCTSHPCHLTIIAEYFFNNDLEFLKSSDLKKKYTTSIMKTKAARYEIVGIEDMDPTLWIPTKVGYDKDELKGIKH
nr:hypothetical protein [Tanacetum cinerariifolium]